MTTVATTTDATARTPTPADGRAGRGIARAAAIRSDIGAMVRRNVRCDIRGDKSAIDMGSGSDVDSAAWDSMARDRSGTPCRPGGACSSRSSWSSSSVALIYFAYSLAVADPRAPSA